MGVLRERADDLYVGIRGGVGLVHDPERSLAARDQHQRRTHVLGLGNAALHAVPDTELLERGLAVFAGRHCVVRPEARIAGQSHFFSVRE